MNDTSTRLNRRPYWDHPRFPWVVLGLIGLVYFFNRSPYPGFDDGLGFLLDAETGFNFHTNATNHVLFNNLQHLIHRIFFFLPTPLLLGVLTIMCALGTLLTIYRIGNLLSGSRIPALIPLIVLGLSFTFWQQSEIIEVYAFNNLIFANFLYFSLRDLQTGHRKHFLLVSLLLGLGLLTHIQNILSIPFFLYYLLWKNELTLERRLLGLLTAGGLFFLLFIPPILGGMNSASAVFFDRNFKGSVLGFDFVALLKGGGKAVIYLLYNFHIFLFLILHGWHRIWKDRRVLFFHLMLLFLPYLGFALKYNVNDNHVFFLVAYLLLVIPSVFSFVALFARLKSQLIWLIPLMLVLSPAIYGITSVLGKKVAFVAEYDREKAYKGGATHLLWPGKATARDPLALAKKLYENDPDAFARGEIEWNYPAALELLRLRGEI